MPLVWREQMSVGNNLIDKEHRYLIEQINAVETAVNSTDNHDILVETLGNLVDYTKTHFDHEEQIQLKFNFPDHENHKKQHQQIMQDLYSIKKKLDEILGVDQTADQLDEYAEVTDSELNMLLEDDVVNSADEKDLAPLVALIRSWIIDHVLGTADQAMKPYLKKLPADFS